MFHSGRFGISERGGRLTDIYMYGKEKGQPFETSMQSTKNMLYLGGLGECPTGKFLRIWSPTEIEFGSTANSYNSILVVETYGYQLHIQNKLHLSGLLFLAAFLN